MPTHFFGRAFFGWLFATITLAFAASSVAAEEQRPNIVWITSEDNAATYLRLYQEGGAAMPSIERLAESGLVFRHAFSNAPVCSVARTTLITGMYAPRVGAQFHRASDRRPMPQGTRMFPAYLRDAGYYTSNNAKEDYNFQKGGEVWDVSGREATYRGREPGQPFFHVQNFMTTHEGQLHFAEDDIAGLEKSGEPNLPPYLPDTPLTRQTYQRYLQLHRNLDKQIGAFLEQLESDALLENTIVFYFGDHGGVLPRSKGFVYESGLRVPLVVSVPEKWRHLAPAEPGSWIDGSVSFVDFAPTVLRLAGVAAPDHLDGKAFLGKGVRLAEVNRRESVFGYADRFDEKSDMVRSLRVGNLKYIRNYQPFTIDGLFNEYRYRMAAYCEWQRLYQEGNLDAVQRQFFERREPEALYDLSTDPHETRNLAGDPRYKKDLKKLRSWLTRTVKSLPDLSFYPEPALLELMGNAPIQFGESHRDAIGELVEVANLQLKPFGKAKQGIGKALASENPWKRYWALVVCSSFGEEASEFVDEAKRLAKSDGELVTRARAAEFLGLVEAADPAPLLHEAAKLAETPLEVITILNSAALLQQLNESHRFEFEREWFPSDWLKAHAGSIEARLVFLEH